MEYLWQRITDYIQETIYPLTFSHIIYIILFTVITTYITDYFLNYKLFKWIYVTTIFVLIYTLYSQGDRQDAAKDAFKLVHF